MKRIRPQVRRLNFVAGSGLLRSICNRHYKRDIIKETKQTIEQHTKKVVQMHMLERKFTQKLEKELKEGENLELYGKTLTYKRIFLGRINRETGEQWVTVEEFIDGEFIKYVNNTGIPCGVDSEIRQNVKVWHTFRMSVQTRI